MGPTCRCTYFLLANGCVTRFTRLGSSPSQKSLGVGTGSGSSSLALALCEAEGVAAGGALAVEMVCCANPGSASAADKSSVMNIRFFFIFLPFSRVPHGGLRSS